MLDPGSSWLSLWIYVSAWASASGWILSGLGMLNPTGYALTLMAGILILWRRIPIHSLQTISFAKIRKRFSRPLPIMFACLSALAFIGGVIYAPNNYDYLSYRFPRVLHWTAQNSWHWIHTANPRMNYQAPGFEWLMIPLFVFFKTDRLFFLINLFCFCLLPSVIFSVFRRLGISRHSCWIWMWLLPAGYCYVLQAGSVGNDSFSTLYLLAALHFALLGRETKSYRFIFLSWLAICLLTGAKLSNVPLVLPWMVLAVGLVGVNPKPVRPALAGAALLGLLISIVPTLILNSYYSGDWTGDPINSPALRIRNPAIGLTGNLLQLASGNLAPPVFPWANEWNQKLPELLFLKKDFPRLSLKIGEIQIEERAGIGFGITLFFLLVLIVHYKSRKAALRTYQKFFTAAVLISALTFLAKFGPPSAPRLFAPYYVGLIASLMMHVKPGPQQRRIWFNGAFIATLFAVPVVIFSPSRPLWPADTVTNALIQKYPKSGNMQRAFHVYSVYRDRSDSLGPLRSFIPESEKRIGLIQSGDDPEATLWIPFGSWRVVELFPGENPCDSEVSTVVIHQTALSSSLQNWLKRHPGKILGQRRLITKVSSGPEDWYVVRMDCSTNKVRRIF